MVRGMFGQLRTRQSRRICFADLPSFTGTSADNAVADFYNSTGVDDPTPTRFAALDKDKLAQEHEAIGAFPNPPRYWTFDEFRVFEAADDEDFGGIDMTWMGVVTSRR